MNKSLSWWQVGTWDPEAVSYDQEHNLLVVSGSVSGTLAVFEVRCPPCRKVDIRLPGKGNFNCCGARPVF